jgi:tetratricopeptide (TPR) repeat protein
MARYTVRDTESGKKITFQWNGDQPPTQSDMQEVFNQARAMQPTTQAVAPQRPLMQRVAGAVAPYTKEALPIAGMMAGGGLAAPAGPVGVVGGAGLGYAAGNQLQDMLEQYGGLVQPKNVGKELGETARDIQTGIGTELIGGAIGKAAGTLAKPLIKKVEPEINKMIDWGINKAIRPSVSGKASYEANKVYINKAREAVKTIVENKNNLNFVDEYGNKITKLPKTLDEFNQAISNTKRNIFKQYDSIAKAGKKYGRIVGLDEAIPELNKIIRSKPVQRIAPEVAEFAIKRRNEINAMRKQFKKYTTVEAQEAIALYNQKLKTYFKSDNPNAETIAKIDAMLANTLRKNLDDVIEKGSVLNEKISPVYQRLKNKYGALKAIEKDVNHRTIVNARKNQKGLIDFTDIFTSGDIIGGLAAGSPVHIAKGIVGKTVSSIYKYLNEPNTIVNKMFSGVEKAMEKYPQTRILDLPTAIKAGGYTAGKQIMENPQVAIDTAMGATASPAGAMTVDKMATQAYLNGDYTTALNLFKQAIRSNPKNAGQYKTAINQILMEIKGLNSRGLNNNNEVRTNGGNFLNAGS